MHGGDAFGRGRTLGMTHGETYKLMQITMSSTLSTPASPIVLSETLPYLTESDDDDTSPQIFTGSPALIPIPIQPLPPVSNNDANLPFMQIFIANIFIF